MREATKHKVLICTGSLISANESSILSAARKLFDQSRHSSAHWSATQIKAVTAELYLYSRFYNGSVDLRVKHYLKSHSLEARPELTEVVLATALEQENIGWEAMSFDCLYSNGRHAEQLLNKTDVVFISTTFLHDLSELIPLITALKKPHNKIVVGGSLSKSLESKVLKLDGVDALAIGYGEVLVPILAQWIRNDFKRFPEDEDIEKYHHGGTTLLKAIPPKSKNLDFLPTPRWELARDYHQKEFQSIYYESVRGCPYRCLFCNYPFLFNDKKFRTKSAIKIAEDWEYYARELKVKTIICLDSLFTMPKERLLDLCERLITKDLNLKWICYARADDLVDLEVVTLMKKAGAIQVQIGVESGNQAQLDRMNKRCTVENNLLAIKNCRKAGITTLVSLIIGYPGETAGSIEDTYNFMKMARPDFYFLAPFSVRVENVPVMLPHLKSRFGLKTVESAHTFAPYWKHNTMDCSEIGGLLMELHKRFINERISLEGTLFYKNIEAYDSELRAGLLKYQRNIYHSGRLVRSMFSPLHKYIHRRLQKDIHKRRAEFA